MTAQQPPSISVRARAGALPTRASRSLEAPVEVRFHIRILQGAPSACRTAAGAPHPCAGERTGGTPGTCDVTRAVALSFPVGKFFFSPPRATSRRQCVPRRETRIPPRTDGAPGACSAATHLSSPQGNDMLAQRVVSRVDQGVACSVRAVERRQSPEIRCSKTFPSNPARQSRANPRQTLPSRGSTTRSIVHRAFQVFLSAPEKRPPWSARRCFSSRR